MDPRNDIVEKLESAELLFEESLLRVSIERMQSLAESFGVDEKKWKGDGRRRTDMMRLLRSLVPKGSSQERLDHLMKTMDFLLEEPKVQDFEETEQSQQSEINQDEETSSLSSDEENSHERKMRNWRIQREKLLLKKKRQKTNRNSTSSEKESDSLIKVTSTTSRPTTTKNKPQSCKVKTTSSPSREWSDEVKTHGKSLLPFGETSILRKEFRIVGPIGDPEKMPFISIKRQLNEGKERGFTEKELINGVLKAITDSNLRNFFERKMMNCPLSLDEIIQHLETHSYKEKTPTEACQELNDLKQNKDEDPGKFLTRALACREAIVTSSSREGEVAYTQEQAQQMFLRALQSGLDDRLTQMVGPYLQDPSVSDIVLARQINLAQNILKLRNQKDAPIKEKKIAPKVGSLGVETEMQKTLKSIQEQLLQNQLEMKQIQEKFAEMGSHQKKQPQRQQNRRQGQGQRPKCSNCQQGNVDRCNHCMKCGAEGHAARGCLNGNGSQQGNQNRLPQRDQQ